jgi:hypothetical protein
MAQYIAMIPADEDNEEMLQWRIDAWKNKHVPEGYAFPGDPLNRESKQPVAVLSDLGKKLLGIEKW